MTTSLLSFKSFDEFRSTVLETAKSGGIDPESILGVVDKAKTVKRDSKGQVMTWKWFTLSDLQKVTNATNSSVMERITQLVQGYFDDSNLDYVVQNSSIFLE
jgi:hypothetical protein